MALVLNVIGGKVSFFAAAREVKRENDVKYSTDFKQNLI